MNTFAPTFVLRPRADATSSSTALESTTLNGCVTCPDDNGSCPDCSSGQQCYLTARTCDLCPEYTCVSLDSSLLSNAQIGGIAGGVAAGVLVLALAAFFFYRKWRNNRRLTVDSDGLSSKYGGDLPLDDYATSPLGEKHELSAVHARRQLGALSKNTNSRLSSYESFMRPPAHSKRGARRQNAARSVAGYTGTIPVDGSVSKRNSVATTISTTNASNILPIAYIPGVTIRPTKNNTRSLFLNDTDSVFSDFTGIDAALIVQERADSLAKKTMTAVKAQPKLVNVARIDEDILEEDEDEAEFGPAAGDPADSDINFPDSDVDSADSADSDVDSDIGEINRATSTRRNPQNVNIFEDLANLEEDDVADAGSGDFVLDISTET